MAPSQLETGGQKAVQGTVLDAKSRLSALIGAGFSRFNKVPTNIAMRLRERETATGVIWGFIDNSIRITAMAQSVLHGWLCRFSVLPCFEVSLQY